MDPSLFPANYTRLVRYVDQDGNVRTGEPVSVSGEDAFLEAKDFTTGQVHKITKLLPPVDPTHIICVGLNYRDHADEVKITPGTYPVLFSKAISSATGHNDAILLPAAGPDEVDYEGELAVVIGRKIKNATREQALECVYGYTAANDVSARVWQFEKGGTQWIRSKGFDTFCPLGPVLVSPSLIPDPNALTIKTILNGEVVQSSNTQLMINSVIDLICFMSQDTTLLPGTVILTGTPAGVGFKRTPPVFLKPGDKIEVVIESIGTLSNRVEMASRD
eukprot:comp5828_c0_seq1/m.1683 comp5828_c0_seq1/g.1683  ORF comp5828_c0_seq1/g.1683 comp5828_c0_seq1/m.1683 type:complete len:276 (-) comp5828_c0_seq1:50-877(-)